MVSERWLAATTELMGHRAVFHLFDLDNNNTIESEELMQLGAARRALGQKSGVWDEAANEKLVAKLGGSVDGKISGEKFVQYFAQQTKDLSTAEFEETIKQFKLVAQAASNAVVSKHSAAPPRRASIGADKQPTAVGANASSTQAPKQAAESDIARERALNQRREILW